MTKIKATTPEPTSPYPKEQGPNKETDAVYFSQCNGTQGHSQTLNSTGKVSILSVILWAISVTQEATLYFEIILWLSTCWIKNMMYTQSPA